MTDAVQWYYSNDSQKNGPVSREQLAVLIHVGAVTAQTLVWTTGMSNWQALSETPLRTEIPTAPTAMAAPPPPPPRAFTQGVEPVNFSSAISLGFKNYVNFSGRSTRPAFWYFMLFIALGGVAAILLDAMLFGVDANISPLYTLFALGILLPELSAMARRLHDTDRSAWLILIFLIPLVGIIVLIVFLCQPSTPGHNRFG